MKISSFAAADQAAFGHGFVGQIETHDPGFFLAQEHPEPPSRLRLQRIRRRPNPSVEPSSRIEHFGRLKAGNRAPNLNDRCQRGLAAFLPQPLDFVEDINFHRPLSLTYLLTLLACRPVDSHIFLCPAIQTPKSVTELLKLIAKHGKRSVLRVRRRCLPADSASAGKVVIDLTASSR